MTTYDLDRNVRIKNRKKTLSKCLNARIPYTHTHTHIQALIQTRLDQPIELEIAHHLNNKSGKKNSEVRIHLLDERAREKETQLLPCEKITENIVRYYYPDAIYHYLLANKTLTNKTTRIYALHCAHKQLSPTGSAMKNCFLHKENLF
ncbi:hypothetical protein LOAG_10932 [Loa loa]|uniref:Uncharacterized protein n=1 Tax=Loa loa TaxID=7209 RepID=A0A1S0TPG5_LOALO|nr:hypothetical protein LOAG_10932 [Loa loa]EFO17568.1 hypothetical protein LOAG_10932 [Loa loa]